MNVYYVADVRSVIEGSLALPAELEVRPMTRADVPALAHLYLRAYDEPDTTLDDAVDEMSSALDGTWGVLWGEASPIAWVGSEPVAVVQTVRRPSMDDAPDCPGSSRSSPTRVMAAPGSPAPSSVWPVASSKQPGRPASG
jgi:hypothetical protein